MLVVSAVNSQGMLPCSKSTIPRTISSTSSLSRNWPTVLSISMLSRIAARSFCAVAAACFALERISIEPKTARRSTRRRSTRRPCGFSRTGNPSLRRYRALPSAPDWGLPWSLTSAWDRPSPGSAPTSTDWAFIPVSESATPCRASWVRKRPPGCSTRASGSARNRHWRWG
ncbi:hypothetical protein D3C85_1334870 [compost metagenome]